MLKHVDGDDLHGRESPVGPGLGTAATPRTVTADRNSGSVVGCHEPSRSATGLYRRNLPQGGRRAGKGELSQRYKAFLAVEILLESRGRRHYSEGWSFEGGPFTGALGPSSGVLYCSPLTKRRGNVSC